MLEITIRNCQKCDLETIIDRIIKSWKTTNLEFLKLKEKLGLYPNKVICDEQEFISTSEESFKEENIFTQHDVENKQLKEENEKLRKEESEKLRNEENEKLRKENEQLRKENEQLRKNNVVKDAKIKELIGKLKEIKSPKEDKNGTDYCPNWFDKNILAIIESNKFNYKNKIGKFKYIEIKDQVNNIRNNAISEIPPKKGLNILNEIKNAEKIIKKRYTSKQKELLNLFNDLLLDTILTNKTLTSKTQEGNTLMSSKEDDERDNTLMSSKEDEMDKTLTQEEIKEIVNERMNQNNSNIKQLNSYLHKIIDKSKSFEDQVKSIKKVEI